MNTKEAITTEVDKGILALQQARDEVKLKLHLAGMDAKDEWNKLEPKILEAEAKAKSAVEGTPHFFGDLLEQIKKFASSLGSSDADAKDKDEPKASH